MKRLFWVTAAVGAAVAVFVVLTIQPKQLVLSPPTDGTIPGVIHVHSNRSDGLSGPDDIAAAAARAGLKFVVLTDHGDATRRPDPPAYRSGVLCLDGVEVSTTTGHYVVLDMPAAPYPLGGEARDVIEDVRRLGGFGVAAHPDSPKLELRWREWSAPFDAIELVNPDSGWRSWVHQPGWRPKMKLLAALVDYPFRSAETITGLLREAPEIPARWAALTQRRRVVTLAGADAHAKLALRNTDPGDTRNALPLPGYEASFRVLSVHVRTGKPPSGNAAEDGKAILEAIRAGHVYTAIDGIATPASLEVTATNAAGTAQPGDELGARGPVTVRVRTNAPPGFTASVWNGTTLVSGDHREPDFSVTLPDAPAVYWVSVRSTGRSPELAWVTSNPIYIRGPEPLTRPLVRPSATTNEPLFDGKSTDRWRIEHDATSLGATELAPIVGTNELRFRWALSGQITPTPFIGLVADTPNGVAPNDRLRFTVRAERPMRVSVQLRVPQQSGEAVRWHRSVYVSTQDEERTVFFSDMLPVGSTETFRPPLADVRSVLFVVDPVNTKRESAGRIWFKSVDIQR